MTRLKTFNTLPDWNTAKDGGNLVWPSVGFITEDSSVIYMKKPIHMLPIKAVFYDSSNDTFVKLNPDEIIEANPNYTPIGVEVIPAEHDVYGTGQAGIMSLAEMNYNSPDVGGSEYCSVYWGYGNSSNNPLPDYGAANYIGVGTTLNNGVVQGTTNSVLLPSDKFSTVAGLDGKSSYCTNNGYQAPSPFNGGGSRNEAYYTTAYSNGNALSDFDGIGNTNVITSLPTSQGNWKTATTITHSYGNGYYPAAYCCWRFHTAGTQKGQWYLPACGELGYVINRISAINTTINKVNSVYDSVASVVVHDSGDYWSSSEYDWNYARCLSTNKGKVDYAKKRNGLYVRAFIRL